VTRVGPLRKIRINEEWRLDRKLDESKGYGRTDRIVAYRDRGKTCAQSESLELPLSLSESLEWVLSASPAPAPAPF